MIDRGRKETSVPELAVRGVLAMLFLMMGALAVPVAQAQYTFTPLHDFTGTTGVDGENPTAGLIADSAGNLYGTASSSDSTGAGAVFEINPAAKTETVLYTFNGSTDGGAPVSALVMDPAGNLYGTASYGGAEGDGAVFELSPMPGGGCPAGSNTGNGWCETVIYSFTGGADGVGPIAALAIDSGGNLYSTTSGSLVSFAGTNKCGSVFKLSPGSGGTWIESTLYDFTGSTFSSKTGATDGCAPEAAVVFDASGNLYGTTAYGGTSGSNGSTTNCQASRPEGCGIVYELSPMTGGSCPSGSQTGNGWCESILYNFMGYNGTIKDGYYSTSDLTFYNANLYGTTQSGGTSAGFGTVFELSSGSGGTWTETILHNFTRNPDGSVPLQGVVFDSQGNLYGTTSQGGNYLVNKTSDGTAYEISSTGTFSKLYQFTGGATDGMSPGSKLLIDSFDNLYGTSYQSGPGCDSNCQGYGSVWKLVVPPVNVSLSSSLNPSTYGQSVTFTATVTPTNGGTPTGTITFMDGATTLGSGTLSSGSTAFTTSALAVGPHSITGAYSGDSNYSPSTSSVFPQTVNQIPQTITCSGIPASAVYGTTFTASCTGGGSGNPVLFNSGGGCTISANSPSPATFTMISGTNACTVLANQAGNTNYAQAPTFGQSVTAVLAVSTTAVSTSLSPSVYGQSVTFTANVTAGATGTVQFNIDGSTYGSPVAVSSGAATLTTTTLPVGAHTVVAAYSGDTNYGSSSGTLSGGQTVTSADASLTVSSGQNPSVAQTPVTFTATINGAYGLVKQRNGKKPRDVAGTVTWSDSASSCGTTSVSGAAGSGTGTATCTISNLAAGSYTITATYSGDGNHNGGGSNSLTQQVNANASTTSVASSLNPSAYGQAVNFTATVTSGATGTVQFNADGVAIGGPVPLSSGMATSGNVTALTAGTHSITAVYSGDTNYASSTGTLSQSVGAAGAGLAVTSNLYPSVYGQAVTFTATITGDNGLVRRRNGVRPRDVTGSVTWSGNTGCGSTTVTGAAGTGTGTATCTTSVLAVGNDTVSAMYSGDSNHNGGTSGSMSQEVDAAGAVVSVVSSQSPTTYGQSVTLTATISGANGLLKRRNSVRPLDVTGTVTWSDNTGCGTTAVTSGNPGMATCTTSILPRGTDTVTANYSGDSNHNSGTGTVSQVVNPAAQTISVSVYPPSTAAYGSNFTVVATASSGLPITYGLISGSDCANSSGTYTVGTRAGNCTVTLSQPGNNDYVAVGPITESTTRVIAPQKRTVSFTTPAPATAAYQSIFTVTAQSQSPNDTSVPTITVVQPAAGIAPCQLSGATTTNGTAVSATVLMTSGTGTCTVEATWPLTDVYGVTTAKTAAKATKLTPVIAWSTPAAIDYGTPLSATQLDATASSNSSPVTGKLVYSPASRKVLPAGAQTLTVKFTPSSIADYDDAAGSTQVLVNPINSTTTITKTVPAAPISGQAVTVYFTVTAAYGKPTGSVTVSSNNGGPTCTGTVTVGKGTCSLTFSTSGFYTLTAAYSGDNNDDASTSAGYPVAAH